MFDISADTAMKRKEEEDGGDPFDRMTIEYYQRVIDGYKEMAKEGWGNLNWYVIDGEPSIEKVALSVRRSLDKIIRFTS